MTLARLSRGTGTDKGRRHSYLQYYDRMFLKYRDEPLTVVEIGVEKAGSLILWSRYFKNARIIGIDNYIRRRALERIKGISNIELICSNAYSEECIKYLPHSIDIFIDDGPHTLDSQLYCIKHYLPLVKPTGLFIIEDIQSTEDAGVLFSNAPYTMIPEIVDLRYIKAQYDDLLYVIDLSLTQL